jgi:predicted nucleic acid-binding protein
MPKAELFFDSSALVAGIASRAGGARALLNFAELGLVQVLISEQVLVETERVLARKLPAFLPEARQLIRAAQVRIVRDPTGEELAAYEGYISHAADLPILVAAIRYQASYLVTLNRRHFIEDPDVARRTGLRIGTPGDALQWLREQPWPDEAG